jgi:hypothetical protein
MMLQTAGAVAVQLNCCSATASAAVQLQPKRDDASHPHAVLYACLQELHSCSTAAKLGCSENCTKDCTTKVHGTTKETSTIV